MRGGHHRHAATAGLPPADLPAPASCSWSEGYAPRYVDRRLDVYVSVSGPDAEGDVEGPTDEVVELYREDEDLDPVRGVGDGAWLRSSLRAGRMDANATGLVRSGNVVVRAHASQEALLEDRWAATVPLGQVEDAALAAAVDVLTGLGLDATLPPRGEAGPVTRARPVCLVLRDDAAVLVPGRAGSTSPSAGTCPGATGRAATTAPPCSARSTPCRRRPPGLGHRHRCGDHGHGSRSPGPGLGDEAYLDRFDFERGRSRDRTLVVRRGNLIVTAQLSSWGYPDPAAMERDVTRLARELLAAHR